MESRLISIDLKKAKEWYKSDNEDLKDIAIQAFKEEELQEEEDDESWKNIKSFTDACIALDIPTTSYIFSPDGNSATGKWLTTLYKLHIIQKALNGNWVVDSNTEYYNIPEVMICVSDRADDHTFDDREIVGTFMLNNSKYLLIGNMEDHMYNSYSCQDYNYLNTFGSLLACKNENIAKHLSKYFAREILEAQCIMNETYKWL